MHVNKLKSKWQQHHTVMSLFCYLFSVYIFWFLYTDIFDKVWFNGILSG